MVRQEHALLLIDDLEVWLWAQLGQLSDKKALAGTICYSFTRIK